MNLSKWQKIATIVFAIGIIVVFCALTPWSDYGSSGSPLKFGTFFKLPQYVISFRVFYIEIGVWALFYLLALMVLNRTKKGK
jgi:hypothetical protein